MILGVDPGITGGLACLTPEGKLLDVIEMPVLDGEVDVFEILDFILSWGDREPRVCIEQQQSMPKQGVASTFKTGKNYGLLLGALRAQTLSIRIVKATEWKPTFRLGGKDKDASRAMASDLWPDQREKWRLKRQDGLAEAALIGEHLRRLG